MFSIHSQLARAATGGRERCSDDCCSKWLVATKIAVTGFNGHATRPIIESSDSAYASDASWYNRASSQSDPLISVHDYGTAGGLGGGLANQLANFLSTSKVGTGRAIASELAAREHQRALEKAEHLREEADELAVGHL